MFVKITFEDSKKVKRIRDYVKICWFPAENASRTQGVCHVIHILFASSNDSVTGTGGRDSMLLGRHEWYLIQMPEIRIDIHWCI